MYVKVMPSALFLFI